MRILRWPISIVGRSLDVVSGPEAYNQILGAWLRTVPGEIPYFASYGAPIENDRLQVDYDDLATRLEEVAMAHHPWMASVSIRVVQRSTGGPEPMGVALLMEYETRDGASGVVGVEV